MNFLLAVSGKVRIISAFAGILGNTGIFYERSTKNRLDWRK